MAARAIIEIETADINYKWLPAEPEGISFRVKASNDAHIAIASFQIETDPILKVFIGGWNNTKSVIRMSNEKPDIAEELTPNILSSNEYRGFWIQWSENAMTVGREVDDAAFMSCMIQKQFPINFVGVCTGWGATGNWLIDVPKLHEPMGEGEEVTKWV